MRGLLKLKRTSPSLFRRLLLSFMLIIVLLASFNFASFTFFRKQIREEIIRYNTQNLNNTTVDFENHFNLITKLMYSYYYKDRVQLLNKPDFSYEITNQLRSEILNLVSNELLYLEDFMIVYDSTQFVVTKDGSTVPETAFTKFYSSPDYPYSFWKQQFLEPMTSRIYPVARFSETTLKQSPVDLGLLIPLLAKNKLYPDLHIFAFLRADRLLNAFHRSINEKFLILGPEGKPLFTSHEDMQVVDQLPKLKAVQGYFKLKGDYVFYQKGGTTGLTYMNIVPDAHITSVISKLNATLVTLLAIAIVISLATSVFISMRFNNPVQRIVESIRRINADVPRAQRVSEFELIHEVIDHMQQERHTIHQDLDEKNSLLRSYVYTNKLKGIRNNIMDMQGMFDNNKPYVFVLFQLTFTQGFRREVDATEDQVAYFFREYIRKTMAQTFADSHTFQIENHQILTLLDAELAEAPGAGAAGLGAGVADAPGVAGAAGAGTITDGTVEPIGVGMIGTGPAGAGASAGSGVIRSDSAGARAGASAETSTVRAGSRKIGDGYATGEERLQNTLLLMKAVFDQDRDNCYFTIAVSAPADQAGYTNAYEQVLELVKHRQLKDETQILTTPSAAGSSAEKRSAEAVYVLSAAQAQEFETHLRAGHGEQVKAIVQRQLALMQRKEASAAQFMQLAEDVLGKTARVLASLGLQAQDAPGLRDALGELRRIHAVEPLGAFLERQLGVAADLVRAKREEREPITSFVKDYLEVHYREEITLERVAEKLDITGGYLSTYFKEKTGANFLDYVHEVRIRHACQLLLSTDARIQDIAEQVGYNNLNSFNRTFKKITGHTPREYRMEHAQL